MPSLRFGIVAPIAWNLNHSTDAGLARTCDRKSASTSLSSWLMRRRIAPVPQMKPASASRMHPMCRSLEPRAARTECHLVEADAVQALRPLPMKFSEGPSDQCADLESLR
jgi:hypothetical protein